MNLAHRSLALLALAALPAFALDVAVDRAADPCVDFYAFANGNWLRSTTIPPDRARWGSFDVLTKSAEEILERALEAGRSKPAPEGSAKRKALDYYASGMDEASITRTGLNPIAALLQRIDRIDSRPAVARALGELHERNIEPGFAFDVNADPRESTRYLAGIGQAGLGLPDRDYYFLDDERSRTIRQEYVKHIARVLQLQRDGPRDARENAATIMSLETELARASMTATERRDIDRTYNKMTVADLEAAAPGFQWRAYFGALGAPDLQQLNVRQPAYMKRLAQLVAERPVSDWRTYIRWHLLRDVSDKVGDRYENAHFDFYERTLNGKQEPAPRAKRVIEVIGGRYGSAPLAEGLGQLFVDEAFPPQAKARMLELVLNVKEALRDRLKAVEWMTEETRAASLAKLDAMKVRIGYPDRWKELSEAKIGARPFAENWMNANLFQHRRDVARIGAPVDREEWRTSPHIVNAFYSSSNNEIVFPAGILRPPFFDPQADDAANYGGIGMVIGHEITHGFDDRGRRFDKDGNLRDWWSDEDARRYKERAAKIEAQYAAYSGIDGIKVNGKLTLGENISDIGGLRIAYLALQKAQARSPLAPVGGFTPEQRFFLSFANIWRSSLRPEAERLRLRTDSHSLPALRVKGVVASMPEFARAFSCDPAKALLPESSRGDIW